MKVFKNLFLMNKKKSNKKTYLDNKKISILMK